MRIEHLMVQAYFDETLRIIIFLFILPGGVMVAPENLDLVVLVRIQAGQLILKRPNFVIRAFFLFGIK